MWKGKGRSGYGESSTLGDYDDWSCLSRNGKQWKNPITMQTRDLSGADYWHMRKQLTDSYDVPEEFHAVNETVSLAHVLPNGKANLLAYADPVAVRKSISRVSIEEKILPQKKRLTTLRNQMLELEQSYRNKEMSIEKYSLLRDCLVAKLQRAEVLYRKAIAQKPVEIPEDEAEIPYTNDVNAQANDGYASEELEAVGVEFIDSLSETNSLKSFLKFSCKALRKVVQFSHKARAYWQELKEV